MSTSTPIGIRSLAVSFPSIIRTNDYWQQKYPDMVRSQPRRRRNRSVLSSTTDNGFDLWSKEVAPYLSDPFRGSVERRVLGDESSLEIQYQAATEALTAAKLDVAEVDVVMVASLFADNLGMDNTTQLARKLGLNCPVWNLESTCSSALVALQNARALIQTGEYNNALVIVSHFGSNTVREMDTLAWSMGDGAGAFTVGKLKPNQGVLASKVVSTANTYGAYHHQIEIDEKGKPRILTQTGENASSLAETAVDCVRYSCYEAAVKAGVSLAEIDFFVFNTPTAWYANVCAIALGIEPERTLNLYPYYGNIGVVFPLANFYHAVKERKIKENSLVLVYTNGASATAAAMIMRWGDVALGKAPAAPKHELSSELISKAARVQGAGCRGDSTTLLNVKLEKERTTPKLSQAKFLAVKPEKREKIVKSYLIEWLADTLQLLVNDIDASQPLTTWLDSLMAFSLRSRIEADLEIRVPIESFFGDNNLNTLTQLILEKLTLSTLVTSKSVSNDEASEREILSL